MALVFNAPLTTDTKDIIGGLIGGNGGGVTFSKDNGALFVRNNSNCITYTKTIDSIFSMSIWLKPNSLSHYMCPFMSGEADGGIATGFYMCTNGLLQYCNDQLVVYKGNELNPTNYPSNKFTLLLMTFDGVDLKGYRDNMFTSGVKRTSEPTSHSSYLSIGRLGAYSGEYYNGYALDARLYDHALTDDERNTLFLAGPNGGTSSPKARLQII